MKTRNAETSLRTILRVVGSASAAGVVFVAVPYGWMDSIHAALGLGGLPDEPIVGYLARSTSALYAMLGGLFWVISFDLRRYRRLTVYLGSVIATFGAALLVIDRVEGLPFLWWVWEGPFVMLLGITMLLLNRRLPAQQYFEHTLEGGFPRTTISRHQDGGLHAMFGSKDQ